MRKIVYINLQDNDFILKTLTQHIFKRGSATKHRFYLDYLTTRSDIQVCNYIVANKRHSRIARALIKIIKRLEHKLCVDRSELKGKVRVIHDLSDLNKNDIIMYYSHYPISFDYGKESEAKKIVCITHAYGTKKESDYIKKVSPDVFWGDGRYNEYSELYKKNFEWFQGECVESMFVPGKRFTVTAEFVDRKNLAFATGTVTECEQDEFIRFYGDSCYQPLRKQILDNRNEISDYVYSKISERHETALKRSKSNSKLEKIYCWIYNELNGYKQKNYYSFDMVKAFNQYKMCIVPEDINGVPGVGFVEGMSCGCAYIGYEKIDYSAYSLEPGIDYITYDGTIDDLKRVIGYYQDHSDELKIIAENGYNKIKNNITEEKVAKRLFEQLLGEN